MKSNFFPTWMQRLSALLLVFIGGISSSLADTRLYIEDFSISDGETKKVAVCLDTDESTIYSVAMTLAMPTGLQLIADGNGIKTEIVSSRTGALTMESAISNGKIIFSDLLRSSAIASGNGAIFYVFVKEAGLSSTGNITISGVELKRQDKSKVDDVVVTGATVSKNGAAASGVTVAFAESETTMAPGETKTIAVTMDNTGKTVDGFQATLNLPEGWTAEVEGPRGAVSYNATTGRITNTEGISGVSGAVLNIQLTAPSTFAGSAQIKLTGIKATVNFATVNLSDITSTINATEAAVVKPIVTFSEEETVIYPGKTANININMANNGIAVGGFQANLVLPSGWTATVTGKRGNYTYAANTGRIMNYTGVTGEEGALFEVALTAPADFEGEATIQLTNVKATVNMASVKLDDISLKVLDKDAVKEAALAALKAEIAAATTLLGEADKTAEPGLSLNAAIETAQAAATAAEADMMVATADDMNAATATLKAAEEAYTAAVEAAAALAAAKQALVDEITAATELLGEADKTVDPGLALNNAIEAAQALVDNDETTTEQFNEGVETLKAAEEAYDAAVKAAEKAAAKMALTDEVVAATALLGDADKTAEPGKALSDAIDAAKAVLASETSTTEDLNAAVATLKAAEEAYAQAVAEAAEAAAVEAANAKVAELKSAAEALAVSAEAKAYDAENVKAAVAAAEEAIAAANTAIAAVEAKIAEGKLSTENKEALATAIAAAEQTIEDAKTAIAAAEQTYTDQKAADEAAAAEAAAEAAALEAANQELAWLKNAATALTISDEVKASDNEDVKAAVAAAEEAIAAANDAIAAVEAKIAEGKLATDNKEALANAITAAEDAISAALNAIVLAEEAYANVPTVVPGDITGSGEVDADDLLQFQEDFLSGNYPKKGEDNFDLYDVNGDGKINIADMIAIQNLSLGLNIDGSDPADASRSAEEFEAGTLNVLTTMMSNGNTRLDIVLASTADYRAFQMDIVLPEATRVVAENANGLSIRSNDLSNTHRVIGFGDMQNGTIVSFEVEGNGQVQFKDVVLATNSARAIDFNMGSITGINAVANAQSAIENSYDLSGKMISGQKKGLNIIRSKNGSSKKVLVK